MLTFTEKLELLNWAKNNGAARFAVDDIEIWFTPAPQEEDKPVVPSRRPNPREWLDKQLFGQPLPEVNNG